MRVDVDLCVNITGFITSIRYSPSLRHDYDGVIVL